jgi:hypothetical protein
LPPGPAERTIAVAHAEREERAVNDLELRTEFLVEATVDLHPPEVIGPGPLGTRIVYMVKGGSFEGPGLKGTVLSGGDWFLMLGNGAGELDVRGTFRTFYGASIYVAYRGVLVATPEVWERLRAGERVDPDAYYFRTAPRFETGNQRYAWLNTAVCVGVGAVRPGGVRYRIYRAV